MKIYYADPVTGGGKTFAAGQYAAERRAMNFCFVMPTKRLIAEAQRQMVERFPESATRVKVIVSDNHHVQSVSTRLREYLMTVGEATGAILYITHEALMRTNYWHRPEHWHVFVDEVVDVTYNEVFTLSGNRGKLLDLVRVTPHNGKYSRLTAINDELAQVIASNKSGDQIDALFTAISAKLSQSSCWDVFVLTEQFNKFVAGNAQQIEIHGRLSPGKFMDFATVCVLAANFKHSLMYHSFHAYGVEFCGHAYILANVKFRDHSNGARLQVFYLTEAAYSANMQKRLIAFEGRQQPVLDVFCDAVKTKFGKQRYLWMANNAVDDWALPGYRLPGKPHGLNSFQDYDNLAVLSALNATPGHSKFLRSEIGIDSRAFRRAMLGQVAYQALGRGSLRDENATSDFTLIVPDRDTAEDVADMYPGCATNLLLAYDPILLTRNNRGGRPRIHEDEAAKKRAQYAKKKLLLTSGSSGSPFTPYVLKEAIGRKTHIQMTENCGFFKMTHFKSKMHKNPTQPPITVDFADFVDTLRLVKDIEQPSKESCGLFAITKFTEGRKLADALVSQGLILDLDGTSISPNEFAAIFPDLQMMIYSSFRHSPTETRYRVCIPTDCEVSPAEHLHIGKTLVAVIAQQYPDHAVDQQKLHSASLFYLPSKTPDSFFFEYAEGRGALDVKRLLEACPVPQPPEPYLPPPVDPNAVSDRLERCKQYFLEHGTQKGNGRTQLWSLSKKLRDSGCDLGAIRGILFEMAAYAHDPRERRSEIDQLMRDIMK